MKKSRPSAAQRWTVMFIGDHGQVITLKRFKLLVLGALILLLAAAAAAGILFFYNQKMAYSNRNLHRKLEIAEEQIKNMRHQADLLMARIALAEAKADDSAKGAPVVAEEPLEAAAAEEPETPPPASIEEKQMPAKPEPVPAQPKPLPETAVSEASPTEPTPEPAAAVTVEVENMTIVHRKQEGSLRCEFKLVNVSRKSQRITGRAVVILKGDELPPAEWIAMPKVALVDGQPSGKSGGYAFAIRNWRTMRMNVAVAGEVERFNLAEVYVFSETGELWLREVQPIRVQPG